jgi:hypothetical protein
MSKLFVVSVAVVLVLPLTALNSAADGLEKRAHRHNHSVRVFGPPSQYAPVEVKALFDSCWRYRRTWTPEGRELERIWTCGNYIKPNAEFDWAYGSSIADQAGRYGYHW